MKRRYDSLVLIISLVCLLVTACDNSEEKIPAGEGRFVFQLQLPDPIEVETKAVNIGPDGGEKIQINDVWIVQYQSDGTLLHCKYISGESYFTPKLQGYLIEINTKNITFTNQESRFYIIVNGGSVLDGFENGESKLEAALKAKTIGFTNYGVASSLLTAGPFSYTPDADQSKDNIVFVTGLKRAYAKMTLRVIFPSDTVSTFTVDKVALLNAPTKMALFAAGGSNGNYPEVNDANIKTDTVPISDVQAGAAAGKPFYMPENLRGMGTSTTFEGKNLTANGPGGDLDGCTRLVVKGTYKYDGKTTNPSQEGIKVEYSFYLGDNMINNYNIQRDMHYSLDLNLKGANSADLRVTITDGGVAVFDEEQTITNTVVF